MKRFIPLFLLAVAPLFSVEWHTDFAAASRKAEQEAKPIVLHFTGSDWCSWCVKLENEVLDTPEFAQEMGDSCIFVKLDFPRKKTLDKTTQAQNDQLKNQFAVKGFPTLVILDSHKNLLGTTGYRSGGPQAYSAHLKNFLRS